MNYRGKEEVKKQAWKALIVITVSHLLAPSLTSMEKELTLTQKQVQKLTQNTTASLAQFKQIPKIKNDNNYLTYKNKDFNRI